MRVLVLGGTAFIGPHVVKLLSEAGHEIALFHRGKTVAALPAGVTTIRGDRHHLGNHIAELRAFKADVVVDMIAFNKHDAADLVEVFGGYAGRAVVASSCDVYRQFGGLIGVEQAEPEDAALTETSPLRIKHYPFRAQAVHRSDVMYSYDKLDVEEVLRGSRLPTALMRLPMVYGEGDRQRRLTPYLKKIKAGAEVITLGQTHAAWKTHRGYVLNMAHAMALAVQNEASAGQTYNVADETALSEYDFVSRLVAAGGFNVKVEVLPEDHIPAKERYPGDARFHLMIDSAKIRSQLAYKDAVGLDEGLRRTVAWELATLPD